MKIGFIAKVSILICSVVLAASGWAQQVKVEGLTFKIGDDVTTVKTGLHTNLDPEPMESSMPTSISNPNSGKTFIHLRTKGIWAFFNKKEIVESIRFDAPFAGSIAGVKLGDSEKTVRTVMGKPIKTPWAFGANQAFLYVLDDTAYIRFDINEAEGVQTIFINK